MLLSDGDLIRGLLGTYCRLVDAGDFAGLGELLADAVLCDKHGTPLATGAAEVAAMYARTVRLHEDGTPGTQHLVANTTFEEPLADGTARATSSYAVLQAVPGIDLQPIITGTYVDTFSHDERGWRFAERRFGVGRSGRLDHHLTFDPSHPGAPR